MFLRRLNTIHYITNNLNKKSMKKKEYEKPTMDVVEVKQQMQLLAGSNPAPNQASIDDYEDGSFTW